MVRARKPPDVSPGQTYGDRQAAEQMVEAAPLPTDQAQLHQMALQGAESMEPPLPGGLFGQPTGRPKEPITAGLSRGPGPGPEAIAAPGYQQQRTVELLQRAAEITGNPILSEMARRSMRPIGQRLPTGGP